MNLIDYVRILARRGWIILLAMVLTAGSAYVFSKLQTPVYRAEQKILIKPSRPDLGLTDSLKQLETSWAQRTQTELRAKDAIDALKLDMTPAQLYNQVNITPDLNSLQIIVDVNMTKGHLANQVARTYGTQFVEWRNQENQPLRNEDRISAELLDYPKYAQFQPNTAVNVAAGALLGLLVGGVIVFILEFIDSNVVRRANDVERYLQLPVLGNLPEPQ